VRTQFRIIQLLVGLKPEQRPLGIREDIDGENKF
jgi:hypothetical protein